MALTPTFQINPDVEYIKCRKCGLIKQPSSFLATKSLFFNGQTDICTDCFAKELERSKDRWNTMDKICQYLDIPFEPKRFAELEETHTNYKTLLEAYNLIYLEEEYKGVDWRDYNEAYEELKAKGLLEDVVPGLSDQRRRELQEKWGFNYDDEALDYLENLYEGLLLTQNISGALQGDQALKICKISYEIDCRIRAGQDFDKLLASYDKLVKTGEFTPKNVKSAGDFDSMGELVRWLEKKGFKSQFYDGETRDIVDETIKNIQSWNQRLYTNESGIGEEINQRIQSLKTAAELETYYDLNQTDTDFDTYENEGFEELLEEIEDEFKVDLEGEE